MKEMLKILESEKLFSANLHNWTGDRGDEQVLGYRAEGLFKTGKFNLSWETRSEEEEVFVKEPSLKKNNLIILLRGSAYFQFNGKKMLLDNEGDFLFWNEDLQYRITFKEETLLLKLNWD